METTKRHKYLWSQSVVSDKGDSRIVKKAHFFAFIIKFLPKIFEKTWKNVLTLSRGKEDNFAQKERIYQEVLIFVEKKIFLPIRKTGMFQKVIKVCKKTADTATWTDICGLPNHYANYKYNMQDSNDSASQGKLFVPRKTPKFFDFSWLQFVLLITILFVTLW